MSATHGIRPLPNRAALFALIAFASVLLLSATGTHARPDRILYSFCAQTNCADGAHPFDSVLIDSQGSLYGTTANGGAHGGGTIFRLAPDGSESVLYSFCAKPGCADGVSPQAGLIADGSGNLYGTTPVGGANNSGVVFRLAPDGTETVLHAFAGESDGGPPVGRLMLDKKGDLYGVGMGGLQNCFGGCGAVFRVAADGTETVRYAFCAQAKCADGELPNGGLVADEAGNIYGTTQFGGANGIVAAGTVFELMAGGTEKVLWSFCARANCDDGEFPLAGLILDKSGNLYGSTTYGGSPVGTVFRLAPDGTETVLYGFTGGSDGGNPSTILVRDREGQLFGTTSEYGNKCPRLGGCGTIFRLRPDGALKTFRAIEIELNGASGLAADKQGNLYSTSPYGGTYNAGTVFAIRK